MGVERAPREGREGVVVPWGVGTGARRFESSFNDMTVKQSFERCDKASRGVTELRGASRSFEGCDKTFESRQGGLGVCRSFKGCHGASRDVTGFAERHSAPRGVTKLRRA